MRTPPASPTSDQVLELVRAHWRQGVRTSSYLPLGFGAHHWRIDAPGAALFATLDLPAPTRTLASFDSAYRAARRLAEAGLPGVLAPLRTADGQMTVACAGGLLSATAWREGRSPSEEQTRQEPHQKQILQLLAGLHGAAAPAGIGPWQARVAPDLAARLAAATARPWRSGPMGEQARTLLRAGATRIAAMEKRYRELRALEAEHAEHRVPTHGEPHHANQLLTSTGELLLVDWETLALAPRERDLSSFPSEVQREHGADPRLIELFSLEWTLSEIEEYQRWFRAPHSGSEDDRIALQGLTEEIEEIEGIEGMSQG